MLKVVHDAVASNENGATGGSLLDEIVRDGARAMLATALQAEVAAYIDAHGGEVDENGYRLVVRNGFHQPREVVTAAGAVPTRAPRVNDKRFDAETGERRRFSSAILPAWARKSPQVAEVLPLLYLHGLSSSDFGPALEQFLGCERKVLEDHFIERVKARRAANGSDLLTVLCQTQDDEGNSFTDDDIVNHMIFLMMAAHDTSTSTTTTMAYHLAAHPEWQDRARDESARLGDGPLDIEALEKLETLDLVTSRCGW
jgi:hypothetical protein